MWRLIWLVLVPALPLLFGCTSIPPMVLNGDHGAAPVGPTVAALVANLKCELYNAANSTVMLPFYQDDPDLSKLRNKRLGNDPRAFNLKNIFREIEYVGEATFTLDVTQTGAFSPTGTGIEAYPQWPDWRHPGDRGVPVGRRSVERGSASIYQALTSSADFSQTVSMAWKPSRLHPGMWSRPSP